MTGAVSAASNSNVTAVVSDLEDNPITQHLDAVEDSDNSINDENTLKMDSEISNNVLNNGIANSSLEINDIVFDYGDAGSTSFSCENASGVRAEVVNHSDAHVNVNFNDKVISVSDLNAGSYTLSVTTITDDNHNGITKTANVIVKRIDSTIALSEIILDYGETRDVYVNTTGANGITAKINGREIPVNRFNIHISDLNVTANTLTITTVADDNHNSVTETFNIVVNKVNSSIGGIDDVVLDYGESVNVTVGHIGTSAITAKINNTTVNVNDYAIPIKGLDAGTYVLNVTSVPDGNHYAVSKTVNITVNKVNSTITSLNDVTLNYGESTNINLGHSGTLGISARIDNNDIVVDGYSILISDLNAGNHTLTVTSIPDDNHFAVSRTVSVIINKVPSLLMFADLERNYGNTITINVGISGATAITAKIDDNDAVVNGSKITLSGLNVGKHTLTVTSVPDENHTAVTKSVIITINKADSSLGLEDVEVKYGNPFNMVVSTIGAPAVTAKIGNKDIDVDGKTIHIPVLDAGNYTLTVTTVPDDNHNAVTRNASIRVLKIDSEVKISMATSSYHVGDYFTIAISNNTEASVTINGQTYGIKNKMVDIDSTALAAGTYTVVGEIAENNNYYGSSDTATFKISKFSGPDILINVEDNVGEGSNLDVKVVVGDATGIVSINGKNHTLENGIASATFENVKAGEMTISVIYFGDGKYLNSSNSTKVNVWGNDTNSSSGNATGNKTDIVKMDPKLSVSVEDVNVGEDVAVDVSVDSRVTGKVVLTISGVSCDVLIFDGKGKVNINDLPAGSYSLDVRFAGDDYFNASETSASFKVIEVQNPTNTSTGTDNKTDANINVESEIVIPTVTNPSENQAIIIILPDDAKGSITMTVDGKDYVFEVSNGTASMELPKLDEGIHQYTITYSGDGKYLGFTDSGSMNINNVATEDNSYASSAIMIPSLDEPSKTDSVVMRFPADAKGNVTLNVDEKDYVFNVSNGVANVKLPELDNGDYNYTITYSGDDKYSGFTSTDTMNVNNTAVKPDNRSNENTTVIGPKIDASNLTVTYAAGQYYSVTVYGANGKIALNTNVTFTVNGKAVTTVPTDSNGVARFKITQKPGTYKVSAAALDMTVTKALKVKHLLKLKAVKVKKSAKKLVLKATLGKINGKYLKNKKITFKFKGKKYTAKTNKKGVAKVTIKSKVLKKLKVGKKVTYKAKYGKDTVKKSVKVKK